MTTIATDGKTMAGDGLVVSNNTITDVAFQKVRRLNDGRLAGHSGNAYDAEAFFNWLESGGDCPVMTENCSAALVLGLDGSVISYDHRGRKLLEPSKAAIGSGSDHALTAMDAGCSPERAVEIAAARDTRTGGIIISLELGAALALVAGSEAA
jgi:ATP-dependent protease HslVU (ClpYQ) peptidase subunit